MKKIGLWLDHRKALILSVNDNGDEQVKELQSGVRRHIKAGGKATLDASQEDAVDRQFDNQMKKFYADILPYLEQAETIRIYGPGEAKKELEARLQKAGLADRIVETKTMGKMTDRQVIAEIRRQVQR